MSRDVGAVGTASARLALAVNLDRSNYGFVCNVKKTTPRKQTRHHNQSHADFSGRQSAPGTVGAVGGERGNTNKRLRRSGKGSKHVHKLKVPAASGHEAAQT